MCRELEKLLMEERMRGRTEGIITSIRALMKGQSISADDAMQMLQVPEQEKETYRKLLNQ